MDKNFYEDLNKSLEEINELLEKSGALYKDEDETSEEGAPAPAPQGMPESAPAPEGQPSEMPIEDGSPEGQEPAPEGEGEGQEDGDSLEDLINSMSEEQLQAMLQAIQAALASKGGQAEGQPSPEAPAPAAPAPGGDPMAKSKDEEKPALSKDKMPKDVTPKEQKPDNDLKKSIDGLVGVVEKLAKDVAELKAPKKVASKVVTKPVATSSIQVLEKSVKAPERLSKSETMTYLQNQIRQGNRLITPRHVSNVNYANTPDELAKVQEEMVSAGIIKEFPKK